MKRKNIAKGATLILLISALFISCEGWSVADDIITNSTSVTDNYYTVTVYVDSVSAELKVATAPDPETIADVSTAIKAVTGKTLAGWYCEETGALYDSWGETLTGDLTVHATWALTSDNMNTAFTSGGYYALTGDVTVSSYVSSNTKTVSSDLTVDLNGHTLDVTTGNTSGDDARFVDITSSAVVTFANGTLNIKCGENPSYTYATVALIVLNTGTLDLDSVTLNIEGATGIYPQNASNVNITDSTVKVVDGCYALSTNNAESGTDDGVYTIKRSVISCVGPEYYGYAGTGVLINRSASSGSSGDNTLLYISDSEIVGARQALVVRGGKAEVSDSTLTTTGEYFQNDTSSYATRDTVWTSGSEVILATVALGCNGSGNYVPYTANTDVTFCNVTFGENSRWVIGAATASGSRSSSDSTTYSPAVTINIDKAQEDLITVTCKADAAGITVNGTSWDVNTSSRTVSNSKYDVSSTT